MALAASDVLASFDITAGQQKLDISPVLAAVLLTDTATLGLIGMGKPGAATKLEFVEDALNADTVTGSTISNSATTMSLSSTNTTILRIGALLKDTAADEVVQVLTVTKGDPDEITFSRDYDGGGAVVHAASAVWRIIGMPTQEGADASADISQVRTMRDNYMQIFERAVQISKTRQKVGMHAVADELKHQIMLRTGEVKVELNAAVLYSVKSASAGSDTVYRTMEGLIRAISSTLAACYTTASEPLTEAVLNDMNYEVYKESGSKYMVDAILTSPKQARVTAGFGKERVREDRNTRVAGLYRDRFLFDLGNEAPIVHDRVIDDGTLVLLRRDRVAVRPLQGDFWSLEKMAVTGRAVKMQLSGQCTLEIRNRYECFAVHTGLT